MSTPRVVPGDRRVKTAWTDPEHVRLSQPLPEERVNPKPIVRLREADPDDPWVIPAPRDDDEIDAALGAIWSQVQDAGHLDCGGWAVPEAGDVIICACQARLALPAGDES